MEGDIAEDRDDLATDHDKSEVKPGKAGPATPRISKLKGATK
jgi:hypothetical protein